MARTRVVGFSLHTGWGAAVVLEGGKVVDRREVTLVEGGHRFAYHLAAERPATARRVIARVRAEALKNARAFLRELGVPLVALPLPKRVLPALEKILSAHPLLHAAEGELYRSAIAQAAERLGLRVALVAPGRTPAPRGLGPPWGKDQRLAAALALAALRRRQAGA